MKQVYVQSFGCRASQADGASIEAALAGEGYAPTRVPEAADLVVLNTCTVTHSADVDARRVIRNMHRDVPGAKILVTGCYAQRAPNDVAALPGVRWVVGNSHKTEIARIVAEESQAPYHGQVIVGDLDGQRTFLISPVHDVTEGRTRPNLKVQDGCSNRCSFCIIPAVRGRSRSAPLDSVLRQVNDLASRYAEVVLSGINLGRWGRDLPGGLRFVDLLRAVLEQTAVRRLRISSVEPMDWHEDVFALLASSPRFAQHVHMPLQSGSDPVLKRMQRKYRTRHYATRLQLAQKWLPAAAIGADVMAGFPGESEAEFAETVRFIEEQPFTYLHVFTYSERPGTAAADTRDGVPMAVRRERTGVLRALGERKNREFRRRMVGRSLPAVTLEQRGVALTSNFVRVEMENWREPNSLVDVKIGSCTEAGLREAALLPVLQ